MPLSTMLQLLGLAGFIWLLVFQVVLALGAPLGHLSWGGQYGRVLPAKLRLASLLSAGIAVLGIVVMVQVLGWWAGLPPLALRVATFALLALFALSLLGNLVTQSRAERLHGVPLVCVILIGLVGVLLAG